MFENFSKDSRLVIVTAQEEARQLNRNYVGIEHMLLALLARGGPVVGKALLENGASYERVHSSVLVRFGRGTQALEGHIPFRYFAKRSLEAALRQAVADQEQVITPVHLLLGLTEVPSSQATLLLLDVGTSSHDVRQHLLRLRADEPS